MQQIQPSEPAGLFTKCLAVFLVLIQLLPAASSAAEDVVVIGYQGPLTGPEAQVGIDELAGVKYAVAVFNENFAGRIKVSIKQIDDQGDPSVAGPASELAAKDQSLLGIVGPAYSGATIASLASYKAANIPLISPSATRITLTDPSQGRLGFPIFHRLSYTDKTQGPDLYRIARAQVSNPKVFTVDDQSAYGVGLIQYMKDGGATLVGQDSVPDNTTNYAATISKIKTANANVVIFAGYYPQAGQLFKQLRESGYMGVLAGGDGILSPSIKDFASLGVLDGVRATAGTLEINSRSPEVARDFLARIGQSPGVYSLESLDAANVYLYCISSGVRTRSNMLNCVKQYSGKSLSGRTISFDVNGDVREPVWYEYRINKDSNPSNPWNLANGLGIVTLEAAISSFSWYPSAKTPTPTPTPTPTATTPCTAANSIGTASLSRVSDLVVQVDATITACSYEVVVVSDAGTIYRTGPITFVNDPGPSKIQQQFINAKCDTGYAFYINAWTGQGGQGTLNRTPSNRMLSATCAVSSVIKPTTPTFSGVNFVGNNININVNIGSSSSSRPDKVYLVAPKLGINSSTPVEGKISGSTASWSLPLGNILSGVAIPLEIVGEKNGVKSEPLTGSYIKPATSVTAVPPAPTNYTSRIVGSSAIITIQVSAKESSRASTAHLYSSALGIKKNAGLQGDVVGTKALIEVPIKASMAGKKYPITIYLKNSKGESTPLNATLSIPKAPKAPTLPTALPKPVVPKAVICSFGTQTRTFEDNCPPGWEKR
jgi:branched-chain amino acid transport system substrate-binding protein